MLQKINRENVQKNHMPSPQNLCAVEEIREMIWKYVAWLDRAGYESYDPYDIWGKRYGRWARALYYGKHPFGAAVISPLILMEVLCPWLRGFFVKKRRFATADAQLIMGFLKLQGVEERSEENRTATACLDKAKGLANTLLSYTIPGYSGYCWGYPFDWQSVNGIIPQNTPLITATPYCFEAFLKLYEVTGDERYLEIARSIFAFVWKDLKDTPTGHNSAASSYTPFDSSKVVNASAYRAFVLFEAAHRFEVRDCEETAWKNLRFILQSQRPDGSWLYAIENPGEGFIDHFHTCFVLKNLFKMNLWLKDPVIRQAIEKGYEYYRRELFHENGLPRTYTIEPRLQIVRLEMYNIAEAITLGVLLREQIPEAFAVAQKLALLLRNRFQHRQGFFLTRIYFSGRKHKFPFLRWPQAQLFYALTNLLAACGESTSPKEYGQKRMEAGG